MIELITPWGLVNGDRGNTYPGLGGLVIWSRGWDPRFLARAAAHPFGRLPTRHPIQSNVIRQPVGQRQSRPLRQVITIKNIQGLLGFQDHIAWKTHRQTSILIDNNITRTFRSLVI